MPQDQSKAARRVYFIITYRQIQLKLKGQRGPNLTKQDIKNLAYQVIPPGAALQLTGIDRALSENVSNGWLERETPTNGGGGTKAKYFNPWVQQHYPTSVFAFKETAEALGFDVSKLIEEYDAKVRSIRG